MTTLDGDRASKCPVHNFNYSARMPAGTWHQRWDELREESPIHRNEFNTGFWTVLSSEAVLEVLQQPKIFSSGVVTALDPNPQYKWIPEMLDGEEHMQWRRQLGPLFAPGAVAALEDKVRERAIELIEGLADRGECDFIEDFAAQFPTSIFLEMMGLPVDHLPEYMELEHRILHNPPGQTPEDRMNAMFEVIGKFVELIADRRESPRDDIISKALTFEIDGKQVTEEDLLSFCLLMFMAGLDTVTATLGWSYFHLAQHPEDRARISADPSLIPDAIEEFLRAYAIVIPGRKVTEDVEVAGIQMKAGDIVNVPLTGATRDPAEYDDPTTVDITRSPNRHIAFGAGPHRCLGSHLARRELVIALEEWHKRIPDYRLAPGAKEQLEETGGLLGLMTLPIVWDV